MMPNITSNDLLRAGIRVAGAGSTKGRTPRFSGPVSQAKARARLNKWEADYRDVLEFQKRAGMIAAYWSQAVKLRLADNTTYLPDFLVKENDGRLRFIEVKGRKFAAGMAKYKIAREMFEAMAEFVMVTKTAEGWMMI